MSTLNTSSLNRAIADAGEDVTLIHYTGPQTYDLAQKPTRPSETTNTQASISDPTKRDIDQGLGKISIHDKKFMFKGSVDIDLGDNITIDSTSELFEVKQVDSSRFDARNIKKIVFASKIE